jgi:hypothetical protein
VLDGGKKEDAIDLARSMRQSIQLEKSLGNKNRYNDLWNAVAEAAAH